MHAVSFCKCDCGIEIKLLQGLDEIAQAYTCRCGQKFEFLGTLVELYTATANTGFMAGNGKPVPSAIMKASA